MPHSGLLEAFLELRPALLRYLLLRGARTEEAEDTLQEVCVKLSGDILGEVEQPRAYLYRMTSNQFLLMRRTAHRHRQREAAWTDAQSSAGSEVDPQPSAEARLIAREEVAILQRVLDGLPERTRTIFREFRIENRSQREIAADCNISVSAVEKHLARAYQAIAAARLRLDGDLLPPRYLTDIQGQGI